MCEMVVVVQGGADGIVDEDQYKFLYSLGLDRMFDIHMYLVNATRADKLQTTMQSMSANLGFPFKMTISDAKSVPGAYLEHISRRYNEWHNVLKAAPNSSGNSIQCSVPVVFINRDMPAYCTKINAPNVGMYLRMMMQDCSFNGSNKSFADDIAKHDKDYTTDALFKEWYVDHVYPQMPSVLTGWQHGICSAQIDTMISRAQGYYDKVAQSLVDGKYETEKVAQWALAAWYHIIDPSPVDIALIPLYTTGIPTNQLIMQMELSIHNACRMSRKRVMIGVCTTQDLEMIQNSFTKQNPFIVPFRTPDLPDPTSHGILLCSCIQQQTFKDDDVIYFADSNSILGGKDLQHHVHRMKMAPHGTYLSPHRFQVRTPDHKVEGRKIVTLYDKDYVLSNSHLATGGDGYYTASEVIEAYGGCFIISFNAFRAILFTVHHAMPRESVCFSPFYHYGFKCMKTNDIRGMHAITYKDRGEVSLPSYARLTMSVS